MLQETRQKCNYMEHSAKTEMDRRRDDMEKVYKFHCYDHNHSQKGQAHRLVQIQNIKK